MTQTVKAPDGTVHTFPAEATPQMIAEALGVGVGTPAAAKPSVINPASDWDLGSEVLNGISFGTLPNLQAGAVAGVKGLGRALGMDAGKSLGEDYDTELQKAQADRRAYREAHPFWAAGGNVAGGLVTGVGAAKNGVTIVGNMANKGLSNLLPRMLAGGIEGGAYSTLAGAGGAEGATTEERIDNSIKAAKENLLPGVVLGAAAPPVVDLVSRGAGAVRNAYVGLRDPKTRADELLVQSIMRDKNSPAGGSPAALSQAVKDATAAGQPEFRVADAGGQNTQKLLKRAARTPGEFRDTVIRDVDTRQAGQGARVGSYVDEALGVKGQNAYATEEALVAGRRAAAEPLYESAYKAPPPQDAFYVTDTLGKQSVQDALRAAERTAAEKQVPLTELFADVKNPGAQTVTKQVASSVLGPDGQPVMQTVSEVIDPTLRAPTVRGWDFIKRELDAKITQLYKAGDTTQAEAVKATRNALRDRLGADIPDYGRALAQYTDDSASLEAIQTGRALANARNADEAKAGFSTLDKNQRELARTGASREIGAKLENMRPGQDKTQVLDTPNMQGKLDVMTPDPVARQVLSDRVVREQAMSRTRNTVKGGSDTAENMTDAADLANTGFWSSLFSGRPMVAGGRLLEGISRAASGMNEETAKAVGSILMSNDPRKIETLADMFTAAQTRAQAPSRAPAVVTAAGTAPMQGKGRTDKRMSITIPDPETLKKREAR